MSHSRMYHFEYDNKDYMKFDEDSVFEESQGFADYVAEIDITEDEIKWLWDTLMKFFGNENVTRNELSFTIKKDGALEYFKRMRADLLRILEEDKDRPIEDFINFGIENCNWWQLRERIDSDFNPHFAIDDNLFQTPTNFADDVLTYCSADKTNAITLELKQIFDFHF